MGRRGPALLLLATLAACASTPDAAWSPPAGPIPLRLERLEGGWFDLGTARGKVVLVNFFATWCFPCVQELPLLDRLQRTWGPEGLQVVAVSMDLEGRRVLRPFVEALGGLEFPVLLASERMFEGGGPFGPIRALPTTVVLDRDGHFVGAQAGLLDPEATERLVQALLESPGG